MPEHHHLKCSRSLCLHGSGRDDEDGGSEYVEMDPSGRYGRYKEVLGKGAFKTVYRAFDQEEGIEVAWNQVQVQDVLQTADDLDRLFSEVHLLKTLKHKNIMKFYHSWVDKDANSMNFTTEIFTSGTLRQYRRRHKHVDIKAVKNWARQILRGLLYLHSHDPPIIHRDLKCDNILINGNQGEVKIGDLGLATILQHAHAAHSVIGTPEFMAPELYEEEYTELVDIYSFGMCLLEMVTLEYPYSECSNAAQIYKRVITGRKPEALKKVQDPDVRQFIEKCLATVSARLPARELLMDPFLQCDGAREHIEPLLWKAGDLEELHHKSATVQISYKLKETLPSFSNESTAFFVSSPDNLNLGVPVDCLDNASSLPPQSKEEHGRSLDFRVNGKRKQGDTVFLRLRIADSEGQVRNVHFPFDLESDTALCVASEMVAELDLTDQDVTKIAEMIDAAMLALVPEWKPGVAIDEACDNGEVLTDHLTSVVAFEDDHVRRFSAFSPFACTPSFEDPSEQPPCSVVGIMSPEISPPRAESTMHGRFEEVTYHCHRSDFLAEMVDEQCTICSDSSDLLKDEADWDLSDGSSALGSEIFLSQEATAAIAPLSEGEHLQTNSNNSNADGDGFLETTRKEAHFSDAFESLQGVGKLHPCVVGELESRRPYEGIQHPMLGSLQPKLFDDGVLDGSRCQELIDLTLRQQQELRDLQLLHEEALAELTKRLRLKKGENCVS